MYVTAVLYWIWYAHSHLHAAGVDIQPFQMVHMTFNPGDTRKCALIIPINGNVTEGEERFPVILETNDPDADVGAPSRVILLDGD